MALNFSHRPIFPAHISEDNLISPMRIVNGYLVEGVPEKNVECFAISRHVYRETEEVFDYGEKGAEKCDSPYIDNIIDLLPTDPFAMDISTTITAITGWLEDLEVDYGGCNKNHIGPSKDYGLFAGLNFIWNDTMRFQSFSSHIHSKDKLSRGDMVNCYVGERDMRDALANVGLGPACYMGDTAGVDNASLGDFLPQMMEETDGVMSSSAIDKGAPHEAISFALCYLGVKDLLVVEKVCRSLRLTVKNDPLLWRSIHIEKPFNDISDDILLQLTSRAQGNLQCLSLLECTQITDDGLKRVLDSNPSLTKLFVPACTRLSIEGIVNMLKSFNTTSGITGIKRLRIGGIYGVTHEHVDGLKFLLGVDRQTQQNVYKPHFFSRRNLYLLCDDNRAIDVQVCPRCEKIKLIYDCPAEGCQVKDQATQECRACSLCILRCSQCGRCINNTEYEETFCLELLCSDCFK